MFAMETGMDMKRETFQWRQIGKADDLAMASLGGFKLVRAPKDDDSGKTRNDDDCAKTVNGHEDTLALLKWNRGWLGLPSSFSMEPGTLYFIGDRDQAQLGDRWALMTVLTAVRILDMYMLGRASPEAIHVAKTIGVPEETI